MNKLLESQLFKLSRLEILNIDDIGLKTPISENTPSLILENFKEDISKINLIADTTTPEVPIFLFVIELTSNSIVIPVTNTTKEDTLDHIVNKYITPIIFLNLRDISFINHDPLPKEHDNLISILTNLLNKDKKEVSIESKHMLYCAEQLSKKMYSLDSLRRHLNQNVFDDSYSTYDLYKASLHETNRIEDA